MSDVFRIGTRGSELALWQTHWVRGKLGKAFPQYRFKSQIIQTTGDKILDVALSKIGDKGLFTKELDHALLNGAIDLAVHSLKDIPTALPDGIVLGAITERGDVRDALITRGKLTLAQLPPGAVVATGSLRRRAQLLHYRRDLEIVELRGNLGTRFRKFYQSDWDAMILAAAGLERMGWSERISEKIAPEIVLPAVGQGSFGVICREDDLEIQDILSVIDHPETGKAAIAERAMLKTLEGGCQVPIGVFSEYQGAALSLKGCIGSLDGQKMVRGSIKGAPETAEALGCELAEQLLEAGGAEILIHITQKNVV